MSSLAVVGGQSETLNFCDADGASVCARWGARASTCGRVIQNRRLRAKAELARDPRGVFRRGFQDAG